MGQAEIPRGYRAWAPFGKVQPRPPPCEVNSPPPGLCLSSELSPDTEALGATPSGPTGADLAHLSHHEGG